MPIITSSAFDIVLQVTVSQKNKKPVYSPDNTNFYEKELTVVLYLQRMSRFFDNRLCLPLVLIIFLAYTFGETAFDRIMVGP